MVSTINGDQSLVLGPMLWSMGVIGDQSFIIKVSRLVSWHVHLFHSNGHHLCNIWWISTKNTWFESWDDGGSTQLHIWTFLVWIWCQYSKRSRTTCALMQLLLDPNPNPNPPSFPFSSPSFPLVPLLLWHLLHFGFLASYSFLIETCTSTYRCVLFINNRYEHAPEVVCAASRRCVPNLWEGQLFRMGEPKFRHGSAQISARVSPNFG